MTMSEKTPAPVGAAVALDLDAIEARANAATEGTWRADSHSHIQNGCRCLSCYDDPTVYQLSVFLDCEDVPRWDDDATRCTQSGFQTWADADFAAHAREDVPALVAEVRRLTVEAATQREWFEAADAAADRRLDQSIAWMERAEAAEAEVRRLTESRATVAANLSASLMLADAEVVTLRAKVAEAEAKRDEFADLLARALCYVAALARVEALCDSNPDHADTCGSMLTPGAGYPCSCWQADLRAALATTGEGQ